ncbi:MAG: ABC transporter substrate-binding protein [Coriobacteriia bacterium]|nr:ABC transporter substrate-binding protein [Coriobacteriia bacterium]
MSAPTAAKGGVLMSKRSMAAACLVASVLLATAGCASPASTGDTGESTSKEPIRIGAVVSLTGTYAGLGVPEKSAIEMEVARINAAGGIGGRQLEVFYEDDATDPAKAQAATTRLIEQEKVIAIIGATGTGQTMGMRGDIDRAGIPQVSMAGGNAITAQFDPLVFQTPWPNRVVVPFTLSYMKAQGITKIALLSDSGGYGKDGRQVVLDEVAKYGIAIVADETFNAGDTDMSTQLTKIKAKAPQAVWMWAAGKEGAVIVKNAAALGNVWGPAGNEAARLFGTPGNGRKEFIEGAGVAAEGFTFAAGRILAPESYGAGSKPYVVAKDFIDRYTKQFNKAPDIFAGHAFDAITIVADALARSGADPTGPKLRAAIEETKGLIGVGGTFTYSATDHNGLTERDLVIYRIESGAWKVVE